MKLRKKLNGIGIIHSFLSILKDERFEPRLRNESDCIWVEKNWFRSTDCTSESFGENGQLIFEDFSFQGIGYRWYIERKGMVVALRGMVCYGGNNMIFCEVIALLDVRRVGGGDGI